ncbi:MAG TPA: phage virion morphogenesis protein, partial [Rhodospirillales bacterium]
MIGIAGRIDGKSRLGLRDQLNLLTLPPAKRRRLINGIAKTVRLEARKNIRMQRTITGKAMEPRKDKRSRRKMLMGLSKGLTTKHRGDLHADVTWQNAGTAKIAYQHQHGVPETWTAGKAR